MNVRENYRGSEPDGALTVIGAGCWGTTLASLQADNFERVNIFTPEVDVCEEIAKFHRNERYVDDFAIPPNVIPTTVLERALDGASMVIVVVPSHVVREVARNLKGLFAGGLPVVLATKGLEINTGLLSLEVWREEMGSPGRKGGRDAMVLSGPNLSTEIRRGLPAVSVVAGQYGRDVAQAVSDLSHPLLSLIGYHDPLGVQAAGALKNVYAVGCGIARGLDWGDNVTAALISRGLQETACFAAAVGGDPGVVLTPAGVGDFVATCVSPLSRNHDLGRIIAGTGKAGEEVRGVREGAQTAQEALRRCRGLGLEVSLLESIWSVMTGANPSGVVLDAACDLRGATCDNEDGRRYESLAEQWARALGLKPGMGVASE